MASKALRTLFALALLGLSAGFAPTPRRASAARKITTRESLDEGLDEGSREPDELEREIANDMRFGRARLELLHTNEILRRKPRFLPYARARLWTARMGMTTQEEWEEWISLGEKRNMYIPSRPEEYYSERGEWRSWPHWLGVSDDDDEMP